MCDKQTEWIENCRRQFCKMMKAKPGIISGEALVELLGKFVLHLSESPSECYFPSVEYTGRLEEEATVEQEALVLPPGLLQLKEIGEAIDANVKNESLSSVQQLGIKMTVRYIIGKYLPCAFLKFVLSS
ncbi:Protein broad-minded [Camelus dromedarius]|uniref:Protein broad-minded n=1 Tax=Camelus dromedarius TaxID=9838 RepID=A0A5N4DWW2_CAMDR|nr:Protein broad-minded [Camelus dromedarius]